MNLRHLIADIDAVYCGNDPDIQLITDRYEAVRDKTLFVCVNGRHTDGHKMAAQAMKRGAVAVVSEHDLGICEQVLVKNSRSAMAHVAAEFYGHPARRLQLIGVTGTNGKTTTACWIRFVLEKLGKKTALIGTLGADCGNGFENTDYTTPDSVVFNRKLHEALQNGCTAAVAEISSQALHQHRCDGLPFTVGVFTNLTSEHLDYHATKENYAAQKAKLFQAAERTVLNADDDYFAFMQGRCKGNILTYSLQNSAFLTAKNIVEQKDGVSYVLVSRNGIARIRTATTGLFSVYNSMAAIGACLALGFDFESICADSLCFPQVPGRMQSVLSDAPFSVFVDYAHTPDALQQALKALRSVTTGRLMAVFGCGGDRDRSKRPVMGEIASALADVTVLTDDNPRSEDPQQILSEIAGGFASQKTLHIRADRYDAIAFAMHNAKPGDSILIAGKGHEKMQYTAEGAVAFDDVQAVLQIWNKMQ